MKEEIWKPVRGKEEYAEISNLGQIHYYGKGRGKYAHERFTYGSENSDGYLNATIGGTTKGVHIFVYETFNDCDIPKGLEVNHIDENPKNNRLDNLNLLSHGDNMRWGTRNARIADALRGRKLSEETKARMSAAHRGVYNTKNSKAVQALDPTTMEVVYKFPSTREAGRQFGFDNSAVGKCCNGKRKTAYGYIWRYAVQ